VPAKLRGKTTTSNEQIFAFDPRHVPGVSPFQPEAPLAQDGFGLVAKFEMQSLKALEVAKVVQLAVWFFRNSRATSGFSTRGVRPNLRFAEPPLKRLQNGR
jgi:hypothetical protein